MIARDVIMATTDEDIAYRLLTAYDSIRKLKIRLAKENASQEVPTESRELERVDYIEQKIKSLDRDFDRLGRMIEEYMSSDELEGWSDRTDAVCYDRGSPLDELYGLDQELDNHNDELGEMKRRFGLE
ncbi:Oidioi.mRNA.OKI2018_I69.chr2.g5899.t1.cds [Oikopleura dioica]|uniref:Oidioi.mRNA.OKI2018_I69.chr2.g5899.t1.cds n=1 Tax=Oikopleura dioica TaxID=34765 RepID=A0ABN7T7Q7_OIKDI|nr:Oidioi.mRNA.OKI2018_I69.chr2.g5899.t1.cds [Oikopleura dioica]